MILEDTRNDFMQSIYDMFSDDETNDRANQIIDIFDIATENCIELPCKVGDLVYEIVEYKGGGGHALPLKVVGLHLRDEQSYRGMPRKEYMVVRSIYCGFGFSKHIDLDKIGKTVFLTKKSAEQALRERETK